MIEYLDYHLKELEKKKSQNLNEVIQSSHKPLSSPKTTSSKFNVHDFLQRINEKPKSKSSHTNNIVQSYYFMHLSSSPISQNKPHESFTQVNKSIQLSSPIISSTSNESCQSLSPKHASIDFLAHQDQSIISTPSNDTKNLQSPPIFDQDPISQELHDDPLISFSFIKDDPLPSQEKRILPSSPSTSSDESIPSHDSIASQEHASFSIISNDVLTFADQDMLFTKT